MLSKLWKSSRPGNARRRAFDFARDRSGVAAVEFAFVVPVLVTLLTGIIQLGGIMFVQNNMGDVSRETARSLAVGELTSAEAQQFAEDRLFSWGGSYTVTVTYPVPEDVSVEIEIAMADVALLDYLGLFQTGNLRAVTTMRVE